MGQDSDRVNPRPIVIIIGSGPSGSAAAIWAAKLGFRVILLESSIFPRHRPGETLHPGLESIFKMLEVNDEIDKEKFYRHSGIVVQWNSECKLVPFGKDNNGCWLGYQALRSKLDYILLNHAKKLGVSILQPCHAVNIICKSNKIIGVKTSEGNFQSNFVIDAGGSAHWLARKIDLKISKYSSNLIAFYGYAKGTCDFNYNNPHLKAVDNGWIWTAKVNQNLYQWTRLLFNDNTISKNWLPKELNKLEPLGPILGSDVTWRLVDRPSGLGYFITGDAASVLDPASSHGVLKGMMSGIMAVHTINRIIDDGIPINLAIRKYNERLSELFFYDYTKLKEFYLTHPTPPKWLIN